MLILLKITVCLVNTGTWRNQEIEYLCCELTENVSSVLSSAVDLPLDLGQVISPFSATGGCCFFPCSSASSGYAEYSSEQLFLVWMASAEQCEALVMATVLWKVPNSSKPELLWGQLEAGIGLSTEGCSLGKALPREPSIPGLSLHRRDRGDACERMTVKHGISSLPVAREHKTTWSAQTIDFSANVFIEILLQNKRLVVSDNEISSHKCTSMWEQLPALPKGVHAPRAACAEKPSQDACMRAVFLTPAAVETQ